MLDSGSNGGEPTATKQRRCRPTGPWAVKENGRNVHTINVNLPHVGDERWFLLSSDEHFDSVYCDRELMAEHYAAALERNAPIIFGGDFFDAMQGAFDKRGRKAELRKRYVGEGSRNYLQDLVDEAAEFLAPFAPVLTVFAFGNHESSIARHHGFHLTQALVQRLRDAGAGHAHMGGYGGWIRLACWRSQTAVMSTKRLRYFHGAGGGGPVTEDMISAHRQAARVGNCDVLWSGHVHRSWHNRKIYETLTDEGVVKFRPQHHIRTPGYKAVYQKNEGFDGFEVEMGHGARPVGAWWMKLFYKTTNDVEIRFEEAT